MPRKIRRPLKQYGKPTEMMAVRVPADLHKLVKGQAKRDGIPKSRKVVELLEAGLTAETEKTMAEALTTAPGDVFD
ncbi:hypothetical protein [Nitratireductor soli]|uniref:hypothetical protein n=1 Tax=Nitratireductor soli TaxID=1670619 RepID=UPI00065DBFD8|nr:hypothetical protein [Nitratireductor soli]